MSKTKLLDNTVPPPLPAKTPVYKIYFKGALFSKDNDTILCKEFTSLESFCKCYINFAMSSYTIISVYIDNIELE